MDDKDQLRQTLRSARIVLSIQAVLATATCVVLLLDAVGQARDGSAETSVPGFSLIGSVVVAVGLLVSAVFLLRHAWARVLALVIEVFGAVLAVLTLVEGDVLAGLSRLVLAALVIVGVVQYELGRRHATATPPEGPA
ncbi:hypothetical protein L6E12_02080 [Actinokineospora sp. PR83]|uniref:hypothetical protein n=1 Tax=Actinokineospora sp. PR83 TaxID=2884908 RepID=UPI001F366A0F|nr:hypothetical protein [Actinokineospora sp. PR83]MCG8914584.1 hypothetical protein [Actinokineospora sp. PR83]